MDIRRHQERVAPRVGHGANASNEIADRPHGCAPVTRAWVIGLTADPGIVIFFGGLFFEFKIGLGGCYLPLLLGVLKLLLLRLALLVHRAEGRRAILGKENVETVGEGRSFGKLQADVERTFTFGGLIELTNHFLNDSEILF